MTGADGAGTERRSEVAWDAVAGLLVGVGLGSIAYRIVLDRLFDAGRVEARPEDFLAGARDGALDVGSWVVLVIGVALAVLVWRSDSVDSDWTSWLGAGLLGLGGSFAAWSIVDMHGLGRYDWSGSGSDLVPDLLYHGLPALVAAAGYGLLTGPPRRRRGSARSG